MPHRRTTLPIALGALAAAALLPATAPAAAPQRLAAPAVHAPGTVLGAADRETLAVRAADGSVVLLGDDGARPHAPAVVGCTADAVGSGRIAFDCADVPAPGAPPEQQRRVRTVVVTDLVGAEEGRVSVPYAYGLNPARAVGAAWVEHLAPDPNGKVPGMPVWTSWRTGEQRTLDDKDPAIHADLDRPGLAAPYCAGMRAQPIPGGNGSFAAPLRPVQYRAPWALVDTRVGAPRPSNPVRHVLRRCGLARAATAPASLTTASVATLGEGWVAWRARGGNAATLQLLRLRDRRRFVAPAAGVGTVVLTARSAWVAAPDSASLRRIALPR